MNPLPPPRTGIERAQPIVLMTRQGFNNKIKQSPLWESLSNKDLNYGNHGIHQRIPYHHQLLKQERYEMIELITLVIEDRAKAAQIVDTLYKQYMDKVNNHIYLSDGKTIHTYLDYEDKYFAMTGRHAYVRL